MKKIEHIHPPVIELIGDRIVMKKDVYNKLINTLNELTDAVNNLIDNQDELNTKCDNNSTTVQALASSLRSL